MKREGAGYRELLHQAQFGKARELLVSSTLSITRIAQELGYSDAANFSRAFRKLQGLSPSDYRREGALTQ